MDVSRCVGSFHRVTSRHSSAAVAAMPFIRAFVCVQIVNENMLSLNTI